MNICSHDLQQEKVILGVKCYNSSFGFVSVNMSFSIFLGEYTDI